MAFGNRVSLIRTLHTCNGVYVYKRKHRWSDWKLVAVYSNEEYKQLKQL